MACLRSAPFLALAVGLLRWPARSLRWRKRRRRCRRAVGQTVSANSWRLMLRSPHRGHGVERGSRKVASDVSTRAFAPRRALLFGSR
eukprot:6423784-Pyramimonas_sp.AAC.2